MSLVCKEVCEWASGIHYSFEWKPALSINLQRSWMSILNAGTWRYKLCWSGSHEHLATLPHLSPGTFAGNSDQRKGVCLMASRLVQPWSIRGEVPLADRDCWCRPYKTQLGLVFVQISWTLCGNGFKYPACLWLCTRRSTLFVIYSRKILSIDSKQKQQNQCSSYAFRHWIRIYTGFQREAVEKHSLQLQNQCYNR